MHSLKRAFRAEGHIICALTYSERQTTAVHIVFFAIYKIHGHIKSIIHILLKPAHRHPSSLLISESLQNRVLRHNKHRIYFHYFPLLLVGTT
jgi:hypothetical protein